MTQIGDLNRVMRELAAREAELQGQEERARQAETNAVEAMNERTEAAGDAAALAKLREMAPMYEARARKARELLPLLREFWLIESDIRRQESQAYQALADTQRYTAPSPRDRFQRLRESINLPERKFLGIPAPSDPGETLAHTALFGVVDGYIGPRQISVQGRSIVYDFTK